MSGASGAAPGHSAPRRSVRMCVRCQAVTDNPTVVCEVHQSSGPGFNVYACEACAPHFPPLPDVLDLLPRRRPPEGAR